MKMMQKDVKHNTVYYADWEGTQYLVLYDETNIEKDRFIRLNDKSYAQTGYFSSHSYFLNYLNPTVGIEIHRKGINIREATPEEDKWLRKCIEEGRYVECPREEIINNYQIY